MKRQLNAMVSFLSAGFLLTACHMGGMSTQGLEAPSTQATLNVPVLTSPGESTYYSRNDTLTIAGLCNSGATVFLAGAEIRQTGCVNSTFSFTVTALRDGIYPYFVSQTLGSSASSLPATLFWIRKRSVSPPTVTTPSTNPFRSGSTNLTISGNCESGSEVRLSGAGTDTTTCDNSAYTLSAIQFTDGTYNFQIQQEDPAGNTASINFQWIKSSLTVAPSTPQVVAGQTLTFTVTGGSGTSTGAILTNNSGATFNPATNLYTAGTLARVTDTLRFQDTQGNVVDIPVRVVADVPDHLDIPTGGDNTTPTWIDDQLSSPLLVRVVDRYGNPVTPVFLDFTVANGDAKIIGSFRRSTDADGLIATQYQLKSGSIKNRIHVKPSYTTLPDVAGSGKATLNFLIYSKTANKSDLGSTFPTTSNPDTIRTGDFNNDGTLDVAILNKGEPSLMIFQGLGNGLFATPTKIRPICIGPSDFITRDFNGDGFLDFAFACAGSDRISVVLSDGTGGYLPVAHTNVQADETLPVAIESADFNGDGKADLVTAASGGSAISLRTGNGDGTFQAPVVYTVGLGPSALGIGDFNKDGKPDVAVLNSGNDNVGLLLNNGSGAFLPMDTYQAGSAPSDLAVADLNGDGFDDVTLVNYTDNTFMSLLNDQFGTLNAPLIYTVGTSPASVVLTDLDGDGQKDAVVANSDDNSVTVLQGKADGSFEVKSTVRTLANPVFVQAGDFNKDGKNDILVANNGDQRLQFLAGQGDLNLSMTMNLPNAPSSTATADFDGDGHLDMVVAQKGSNALKIFKGNSLGLWTETATLLTLSGPVKVITSDFNLDGKPDIAVIHQNTPAVRIYLGDGVGGFGTPADFTTGLQPAALVAKDLNRDGYPDLVVANSGSNSVSVLLNDGAGAFLPKSDYAAGGNKPVDVAVADMNNDNEMDIITANFESGNVSVLLSNGGATYQPAVQFTSGAGSNSLVVGFFNADDIIDVAVANEQAGNVAILLGQGDGSLGGANTFWANTEPHSLQAGDLNGDGNMDLIVANPSLFSMMVLYGSGNGQFNLNTQISTQNQAVLEIELSDINQDHALDLITIDPTNGLVQTWMGH